MTCFQHWKSYFLPPICQFPSSLTLLDQKRIMYVNKQYINKQNRHLPHKPRAVNTSLSLYIYPILPLLLSNNPPNHNSQKPTPIEHYHLTIKKYFDIPYQTIRSFAYPTKNSSPNLNTMSNSSPISTFSLCRPNPAPKPCPTCGSTTCGGHGKTFGPR
jgi:hypothetical protein